MKFDLEALKFITCTLDAWQSPKLLFQCKPQKTVLTGNQLPYAHFLQPDHHALKCRHLLTYQQYSCSGHIATNYPLQANDSLTSKININYLYME